ncbi:High mobility group protein TDP-1 [Dorcoceras hygrometricum]|uniref:High mobility group protein TDP-1 n=1 Tax=Dorcoceras hygrometricum TaxID=472368 RepID=A0A2Z7BJY7_9LAMI|nr:High mobility group protein TDP-1 [Dorcoceras hygrometricum]
MADDYVNQVTELPPISSPTPSIPFHLTGFLAGDTVRVQGDTGELEFSLHFSVQRREQNPGGPGNFSDANIQETDTFCDSVDSLSTALYMTPTSGHETHDRNAGADEPSQANWMSRRDEIVTRLRSGVLSPVKYNNARGTFGVFQGRLSSRKKTKMETGKGHNAFERMLRRRRFPLRPCNSYAFFVMANWGVVKCSSFEETSKRLSEKWCTLPHGMKKEYENLASKDSARYTRQCLLLENDVQEEAGSGLLEDMK